MTRQINESAWLSACVGCVIQEIFYFGVRSCNDSPATQHMARVRQRPIISWKCQIMPLKLGFRVDWNGSVAHSWRTVESNPQVSLTQWHLCCQKTGAVFLDLNIFKTYFIICLIKIILCVGLCWLFFGIMTIV